MSIPSRTLSISYRENGLRRRCVDAAPTLRRGRAEWPSLMVSPMKERTSTPFLYPPRILGILSNSGESEDFDQGPQKLNSLTSAKPRGRRAN